jgi:hypothetical protein
LLPKLRSCGAAAKWRDKPTAEDENGKFLPVNIRTNIGPDRLYLLLIQYVAPRRHLVFSVQDGIDEPVMILRPEAPKVERHSSAGILQPIAVTRRAVIQVHHRACFGARASLLRPTDCYEKTRERNGRHPSADSFVNGHRARDNRLQIMLPIAPN